MINNKFRIVFFGTPTFVDPVLNSLKANFDLIKAIRTPQEWNNETIEELKDLNPDFFAVASFGQILPRELLDIPRIAAVNIHPSLLPLYRGPSPIQTAILNGDTITGVTFIKMDEKMDHGAILEQFEEEIKPEDTFQSLAKDLFEKAAKRLPEVIINYKKINLKPQNESKATYTKLLIKQDGFVNLSNENSLKIENLKLKIKAYYPWPGVWTRSSIINNQSSIIKLLPDKQIQVEGKKSMSYKDFINGYEKGRQLLQKLNLEA